MKIGVALSGCDIGGVSAYEVLRALEDQGLEIAMISACGLPSVTALPYALGWGRKYCEKAAKQFLQDIKETDMDMAVAGLSAALPLHRLDGNIPFAINTVNVSDGKIYTFTDSFDLSGGTLQMFPLEDVYDALSATISPVDGLASFVYNGRKLCDFCAWYGCPIQSLRMAGVERIVSVAFVPQSPRTPYQVLAKEKIAATAALADVHISIAFDGDDQVSEQYLQQYIDIATERVQSCIEDICFKILF